MKDLTFPFEKLQGSRLWGNMLVPGGLNPLRIFEQMAEGIAHSQEHYAENERRIPVLYATQMHEMAQYLIDTMKRTANEYNEFIQRYCCPVKLLQCKNNG